MCGILGFWSTNHQPAFKSALALQNLRGPDYQKSVQINDVTLGHNRLSILDTSAAGHQPMQSPCGNYTIVFNGEIYNFETLRKELEQQGEVFNTATDTEVLLRLYIKQGTDCLNRLNGFFAFVIYNQASNQLIIARDRFGIKPLHYSFSSAGFYFGSQVDAVAQLLPSTSINFNALNAYLQFNYIPANTTIYNEVQVLPPAHYTKIDLSSPNVTLTRWYQPKINVQHTDWDTAKSTLKQLLTKSVEKRLVSDVPLGGFLSGGIDSSIISGIAAQLQPNFETFSVGFSKNQYYDETEYALAAAKKFNTKHTVFDVDENQLCNALPEVLNQLDQPFADSSALVVHHLSKETRKNVTVALSGDGADEIFGGYNKHYAEQLIQQNHSLVRLAIFGKHLWKFLPQSRNSQLLNKVRQLNRFAQLAGKTSTERYFYLCRLMSQNNADSLLKPSTSPYQYPFTVDDDLNAHLLADLQFVLQNDMLVKVDRMSMANSLEVRVPFLDHEVVDFAFQLPNHYKINGKSRKHILKAAFEDILPPSVFNRGKKGFEVPLEKWFNGQLRQEVEQNYLNSEKIKQQDIFNLVAIQQLKQKLFGRNPGDAPASVWALIVFQHWYQKHHT